MRESMQVTTTRWRAGVRGAEPAKWASAQTRLARWIWLAASMDPRSHDRRRSGQTALRPNPPTMSR